jgi:RpiR family carbohydrate utilization transcriptional regulator
MSGRPALPEPSPRDRAHARPEDPPVTELPLSPATDVGALPTQTPVMLERIRAALPALAPAEQRVGRLLLDDARAFALQPVAELARRAQVSKPTVVRFCRSVGYDGLADFRLKLAGSVNEGVPFVHRAVDEDDAPGGIVVKVVDNAVSALLAYRNAATGHAFERAIDALARAGREGRRIEFHGVGNSGIVAQDAQHKFFRLGVHAAACTDGHVQVMSATMLQPGDCAVVISNSGRSRDLLDVAEIAQRQGATVIVITASGSPLAHLAQGPGHVLLAADHPEDFDRYSPMVSRLLHLVIVDILTTGVALRLGSEHLRPMLQAIKRNLRARRYAEGPPESRDG